MTPTPSDPVMPDEKTALQKAVEKIGRKDSRTRYEAESYGDLTILIQKDAADLERVIAALEYYATNHERNLDGSLNMEAEKQGYPRAAEALTIVRGLKGDKS